MSEFRRPVRNSQKSSNLYRLEGRSGTGLQAAGVAKGRRQTVDRGRRWARCQRVMPASLSVSLRGLGSGRREPLPILRPLANGCDGRQRVRLFPCLYGVHVLVVPCLLATLKMTIAILIER